MPRAAAMTSTMRIPTFGAGRFAQTSAGEWLPATIDWATATAVPCRAFPVTEQSVKTIWGESVRADIGVWLLPSVELPPEVMTADSGSQTPVQVNGVNYMVSAVKDAANMGKLKAAALRRFTHG